MFDRNHFNRERRELANKRNKNGYSQHLFIRVIRDKLHWDFALIPLFVGIILILAACAPGTGKASSPSTTAGQETRPTLTAGQMVSATVPNATATESPSPTLTPTATPTVPTSTPTPDTRLNPDLWDQWPVLPTVSYVAREIYTRGLAGGNDPHSYSTIGDCQSEPDVFLGIYATKRYWLGTDYQYLQDTIDFFQGSFDRQSLAVRNGLSAPSALSPLWAYKDQCGADESPVACDLRVHKPSIVFINLGTNWLPDASIDAYENYLRQIVDLVVQAGALPVLSTKADDVEGGNRINWATARVAYDYDIPLWNLWRAVQDLPNGGLDASRKDVYLTTEAWDRRNFTALMVLDRLRTSLKDIYENPTATPTP